MSERRPKIPGSELSLSEIGFPSKIKMFATQNPIPLSSVFPKNNVSSYVNFEILIFSGTFFFFYSFFQKYIMQSNNMSFRFYKRALPHSRLCCKRWLLRLQLYLNMVAHEVYFSLVQASLFSFSFLTMKRHFKSERSCTLAVGGWIYF